MKKLIPFIFGLSIMVSSARPCDQEPLIQQYYDAFSFYCHATEHGAMTVDMANILCKLVDEFEDAYHDFCSECKHQSKKTVRKIMRHVKKYLRRYTYDIE